MMTKQFGYLLKVPYFLTHHPLEKAQVAEINELLTSCEGCMAGVNLNTQLKAKLVQSHAGKL